MKTKIIGSAPILLVKDVVASANYYRDKIGFTYDQFWGGPPNFCILNQQFPLTQIHTLIVSRQEY